MKYRAAMLAFVFGACAFNAQIAAAQQTSASPDPSTVITEAGPQTENVPRLVQFNGTLKDTAARPVSGVASVTFAIYSEQDGGTALWSETQNVLSDSNGHFTVLLGSATPNGVPSELFGTGQSRWLGVTIARATEMPRVLLASVPYALRAADADTLGGLPASSYVTAQQLAARTAAPINGGNTTLIATPGVATSTPAAATTSATQSSVTGATPTGAGTTDYIPLWTSASNLGNSILFQSGTKLGVGTTAPASTLDINGGEILRGGFYEYPQGTATASAGQPSHSFQWDASVFNGATGVVMNQAFGFRAMPQNNNTATPAASLDLFYGTGGPTGSLTDTGLSFASNGIVTFTSGQTFPGVASLGADNTFTTSQTVNGSLTATNPELGVQGTASSSTGTTAGVEGLSDSTAGYGVYGTSPFVGVYGASSGFSALGVGKGKAGVWGDTGGAAGGYQGVLGTADDNHAGVFLNNGTTSTVYAKNQAAWRAIEGETTGAGTAIFGGNGTLSAEAAMFLPNAAFWGDISGANAGFSFFGTADNTTVGYFINHSDAYPTLNLTNYSTATGPIFEASGVESGNDCEIETNGDLSCTGTVSEIATVDAARKVAQFSVKSPENWSEDFGSATLANGTATVSLEATFAQTVNAAAGYHVFLTPKGDCRGLYVTSGTASGFEVRETGGGTSSVAFDYRIVAKRVGYETVRLKDVTAQQTQIHSRAKNLQSGAARPAPAAKTAPRPGSASPTAATPGMSQTARQLAAPRITKPAN